MFGSKKTHEDNDSSTTPDDDLTAGEASPRDAEAKKGRPTPKRSQQESMRRQPLVSKDRKVANQRAKEQQRKERDRARIGMMNGEEKYLTRRDRGPQRRYVRDFVDARFSIGELFIPAAILILVVAFTQPVAIQQYFTYAVWGLLALVILDGFILNYILKGRLRAKFGTVERGLPFYAVMRSVQLRPLRMPKPQVKRRQYPE
ncbi:MULTISPECIES: DUF3043 domain-containing protein [Brevibacterium]|uniref:DUF3043 domain-containing protein n=1 Tax=Brevibacterium casei TaxID=33889 RepID=A0A7T4DJ46_9MICO|nr:MULTISPECIES: DUF3043 domain-containing protein [Brevibacterium]MCM1012352.1 DUF3043 domain-containing protein [Brevibacterium sp. XM4083]QQB13549.1 DUF3043 domain-containing protein [Brevibacterium casei]